MTFPRPKFEVDYVYDGGTVEHAVIPLAALPGSTVLDRRDLMRTGLSVSSVVAMLGLGAAGCEPRARASNPVGPALPLGDVSGSDCGGSSHRGGITALAMDAEGRLVVSAGEDDLVKIWQPDGGLVGTLHDHPAAIRALAISSSARCFASVGGTSNVTVANLPRGDGARKVPIGTDVAVRTLCFAGDDTLVLGDDTGRLRLIVAADAREVSSLRAHQGPVRSSVTTERGTVYSVGGNDGVGSVTSWDPRSGRGQTLLQHAESGLSVVAVPPGEKFFAVGTDSGHVLVATGAGALVKRFQAHDRPVTALRIVPHLGLLISAGDDVVRVWSARDLSLLHGLSNHSPRVTGLAISRDGSTLAVATSSGVVKTWSLPSMKQLACFVDLSATPSAFSGSSYDVVSENGLSAKYTMPCGSPIPPGAVCTCNCVPGEIAPPPQAPSSSRSNCGSPIPPGAICTCNCVSEPGYERCVCVPVCTCMAV